MPDGTHEGERQRSPADDGPTIAMHCCSADRTVFVEEDCPDAWIATDRTVTLDP
ncbi:MAG: hypothetical protein ABEJ86_00410 [Halococcoides sp.]